MKPIIDSLKKSFWTRYYSWARGDNYEHSVQLAKEITGATKGGVKNRFDSNGRAVRENHVTVYQHIHPLVQKYSFQ